MVITLRDLRTNVIHYVENTSIIHWVGILNTALYDIDGDKMVKCDKNVLVGTRVTLSCGLALEVKDPPSRVALLQSNDKLPRKSDELQGLEPLLK
jgi:hypothetical protein